jgi:hypothetical protein
MLKECTVKATYLHDTCLLCSLSYNNMGLGLILTLVAWCSMTQFSMKIMFRVKKLIPCAQAVLSSIIVVSLLGIFMQLRDVVRYARRSFSEVSHGQSTLISPGGQFAYGHYICIWTAFREKSFWTNFHRPFIVKIWSLKVKTEKYLRTKLRFQGTENPYEAIPVHFHLKVLTVQFGLKYLQNGPQEPILRLRVTTPAL